MRFLCAILVCVSSIGFISCGNKPSYEGIDTSRAAKEANRNGGQPAAGSTDSVAGQTNASAQPTEGQAQQPAPSQPQQFKPPKFMANGEAKDLPNYPQAITKSIQYGPIQGVDTLSLVLETRDSVDKITAFYEKAIKKNGWTVDNKSIEAEAAEWDLRKAFDNEGKVQVKKDPRTNAINIVIVRTEKITE
jgi:hypothetical protein